MRRIPERKHRFFSHSSGGSRLNFTLTTLKRTGLFRLPSFLRAGGSGTYVVGGVPATESTTENNANNAGWTLAVVYQDFSQPARNLSVFTGLQQAGAAAASVSGFCTPPSGTLNGRLAVSALEGDSAITGDTMRFGPTAALGAGNNLSGPNNPATNFFASQMNGNAAKNHQDS